MRRPSMSFLPVLFVCVPFLAVPAAANSHSDYPETNDWCTGTVDADFRPPPPSGDGFTCDANATRTVETVIGVQAGAVPVQCADDASANTVCHLGFHMYADTATGQGNLGGDSPIASSMVVTTPGPAAFQFQSCYVNTATGVPGCTLPSAAVCLAAGGSFTIAVGAGGAADPPAGSSITDVTGARVLGVPACGGIPGGQQDVSVAGDWTYVVPSDGNSASVTYTATPGNGVCTVAWAYSAAAGAGAYGQAGGGFWVNGAPIDSKDLPGTGASAGNSGTMSVPTGATFEVGAYAWSIGNEYVTAYVSATC